jgi:hypothetical protein
MITPFPYHITPVYPYLGDNDMRYFNGTYSLKLLRFTG